MSHLYSDGSLWMLQSQPSVWISALPPLLRGSDTTFLPLRLLYLSGAQPLQAPFPAVQEAGPWGFPPFPGQRGAGTLEGPPPPRSAHTPLPGGRAPGGRLPPPSPGKGEPEPTRRAPAAHRSTPAAGRARRLPPNSAGAGSHPGWRWPCPEPRKLGGVPGTRRAVPGKEPARGGQRQFRGKGRGWQAGEPRREFGGGPAPLVAPLLSWRRRLRRRRWPVPSRPALTPLGRSHQRTGTGETPAPPRGVTCEDTEPARHLPPGSETLPPGEPRAGAAGGGGAAATAPPGTSPQPIGRRPAPPPVAPPPGAASSAHWLRPR
ncbi:basic salivary proline-rich protein 4-like [Molothrus aeneus]|uniref:basic salivary proline-rich protein 4-like n=1 Tax=Molothrus aeneus TaxID=84833 RepID=UPI003459C448